MSTKGLRVLVAVACLAFTSVANAQIYFNGSFGFAPVGTSFSYTPSSVTLNSVNFINITTAGTFAPLLFDGVTAYTTPVTGLSASPTVENIANYFVFASVSPLSPLLGNGGNGDEYSFTLTSLTDTGGGLFSGSGTLIDSANILSNTPATFSLSFTGSSPGNYSVFLTAVPEPSTISLVAIGLAGAWIFRRRLIRRRVG